MNLSLFKEVERLYEKVSQNQKKYDSLIGDLKFAIKALHEKAEDLKQKGQVKRNELMHKISDLENDIGQKIYDFQNEKLMLELKEKTIEVELYRKQAAALLEDQRKTIIVNSKREIQQVLSTLEDAVYQFEVLKNIFSRFYTSINASRNELDNLMASKDEYYNTVYSAVTNSSIKDRPEQMNEVIKYILDKDIRLPGEYGHDPLGKDLVDALIAELMSTVYIKAKEYAEKL